MARAKREGEAAERCGALELTPWWIKERSNSDGRGQTQFSNCDSLQWRQRELLSPVDSLFLSRQCCIN